MNTFKNILIAVLLVIVAFFGFAAFAPETSDHEGGFSFGASAGPDHYNPEFFYNGLYGKFFSEGGGAITVATTSATYTLTQAELASGNVIRVTTQAGAAALSLTLPATSTMTTLLPASGDLRRWIIANEHTSAATTTTIIAGTGIELQGDGTGSDVINGGVWGALECYRRVSTDVVCIVHEYVAAD